MLHKVLKRVCVATGRHCRFLFHGFRCRQRSFVHRHMKVEQQIYFMVNPVSTRSIETYLTRVLPNQVSNSVPSELSFQITDTAGLYIKQMSKNHTLARCFFFFFLPQLIDCKVDSVDKFVGQHRYLLLIKLYTNTSCSSLFIQGRVWFDKVRNVTNMYTHFKGIIA